MNWNTAQFSGYSQLSAAHTVGNYCRYENMIVPSQNEQNFVGIM
jgi:hypothetical protein